MGKYYKTAFLKNDFICCIDERTKQSVRSGAQTIPQTFWVYIVGTHILQTGRYYEDIENITDAWQTIRINDMKHNKTVRTSNINSFSDVEWSRDTIFNPRDKIKECFIKVQLRKLSILI